jgi:transcription termination factor Rho
LKKQDLIYRILDQQAIASSERDMEKSRTAKSQGTGKRRGRPPKHKKQMEEKSGLVDKNIDNVPDLKKQEPATGSDAGAVSPSGDKPGRPEAAERKPGRPETAERNPGRPEAAERKPGRPEAAERNPGRPEAAERKAPRQPSVTNLRESSQKEDRKTESTLNKDERKGPQPEKQQRENYQKKQFDRKTNSREYDFDGIISASGLLEIMPDGYGFLAIVRL